MTTLAVCALLGGAARVAVSQVPPPTTAPDTTAPRVVMAVDATPPVRRGRFVTGVRFRVGSSENARCKGRLVAGTKALVTIRDRDCFAGITMLTLRVKGKTAISRLRHATKVALEMSVTDAAGNVKQRTLTVPLRR